MEFKFRHRLVRRQSTGESVVRNCNADSLNLRIEMSLVQKVQVPLVLTNLCGSKRSFCRSKLCKNWCATSTCMSLTMKCPNARKQSQKETLNSAFLQEFVETAVLDRNCKVSSLTAVMASMQKDLWYEKKETYKPVGCFRQIFNLRSPSCRLPFFNVGAVTGASMCSETKGQNVTLWSLRFKNCRNSQALSLRTRGTISCSETAILTLNNDVPWRATKIHKGLRERTERTDSGLDNKGPGKQSISKEHDEENAWTNKTCTIMSTAICSL